MARNRFSMKQFESVMENALPSGSYTVAKARTPGRWRKRLVCCTVEPSCSNFTIQLQLSDTLCESEKYILFCLPKNIQRSSELNINFCQLFFEILAYSIKPLSKPLEENEPNKSADTNRIDLLITTMATMTTTPRAAPRHPHARAALSDLSAPRLLAERETSGGSWNSAALLDGAWVAHKSLVPRLTKVATLEGHRGCVNHLRWSRNGALLVSGSDDHQVLVWDYATRRQREAIRTGHTGNIFAVCFVPETNDHIIASGAYSVCIHNK